MSVHYSILSLFTCMTTYGFLDFLVRIPALVTTYSEVEAGITGDLNKNANLDSSFQYKSILFVAAWAQESPNAGTSLL